MLLLLLVRPSWLAPSGTGSRGGGRSRGSVLAALRLLVVLLLPKMARKGRGSERTVTVTIAATATATLAVAVVIATAPPFIARHGSSSRGGLAAECKPGDMYFLFDAVFIITSITTLQ